MGNTLKVSSAGGKKEVLLNGIPITQSCLSCDIYMDADTTTATLVFLNAGIEIETDNVNLHPVYLERE